MKPCLLHRGLIDVMKILKSTGVGDIYRNILFFTEHAHPACLLYVTVSSCKFVSCSCQEETWTSAFVDTKTTIPVFLNPVLLSLSCIFRGCSILLRWIGVFLSKSWWVLTHSSSSILVFEITLWSKACFLEILFCWVVLNQLRELYGRLEGIC